MLALPSALLGFYKAQWHQVGIGGQLWLLFCSDSVLYGRLWVTPTVPGSIFKKQTDMNQITMSQCQRKSPCSHLEIKHPAFSVSLKSFSLNEVTMFLDCLGEDLQSSVSPIRFTLSILFTSTQLSLSLIFSLFSARQYTLRETHTQTHVFSYCRGVICKIDWSSFCVLL